MSKRVANSRSKTKARNLRSRLGWRRIQRNNSRAAHEETAASMRYNIKDNRSWWQKTIQSIRNAFTRKPRYGKGRS